MFFVGGSLFRQDIYAVECYCSKEGSTRTDRRKAIGRIMKNKVILVLLDGLGYDMARREMGFLEGAVAKGAARRWKMRCALPSLSRPLYETIHTGLHPYDHGVTSNHTVRESRFDNVFSLARAAGKRTAAAAYSWFSELYNHCPYDPVMDREVDDEDRVIQHGRFYTEDDFPDVELFRQADMLVRRFSPDYLLVHPMGCDFKGHVFGGQSPQYRRQAGKADDLLAIHAPAWLAAGYHVLVTADHGMDEIGTHGGTRDEVVNVAFYHLHGQTGDPVDEESADQLSVAPTVLALLGVDGAAGMPGQSLIDKDRLVTIT